MPHAMAMSCDNRSLRKLGEYNTVWSVRNRDLEIARLDFLSGLRNRAFARLDFLSELRSWAENFFAACGGDTYHLFGGGSGLHPPR